MDSPTQFPNVKQTLSMIQEVVLYIWNILMGFVGATEESSRQWKLIFERRILKGSIGFPQRWFGHSQNNVLWEVETLVKNLSREDQTSLKELEKIVKGARNTTGAFQASNGQDCNVNNYWVPRQGSRNKSWPREAQDVKKRKTHEPKAGTVPAQYPDFSAGEDVAINDDDVSCCASDLINSVYWESVMQTSSDDMTFHSLPQEIDSPFLHTDYDELLHEAQQTDGDQTDCGINCKRSLSTSVLVDDQYDSKIGNGQSHDTDTVRSMSLPTLCPEKDAELDMLNQTFEKSYGMPDWWLETAEIATCPGTDTDTSTIENMYLDIGRQPILRHVTEPILNDIPHTESEQEIGFDPCTVKGTYVRKFQLALDTNDIINNNDVMTEDEQTGDHGKVNPSCICHPRRDGQRQDCHINSVSDTPPLGSAESVTHRMQHHTNSSARSLGYHQASGSVGKWARGGLDEREFNCNAIHEDNRTSGSAVDLVYSVCSKMSSPVDIGLHTTCPIESCAISDCLLNDKTMPKAESETSLTSHPLRNFIRNMKDKFRRLVIFDDTPLDQIAPMKKDSKVGVNVQQIRHTDPQQAKGHPNMDEFMAPLKFDVSIKPQVEPSHPLDILQTRFGVGPVKLTRRPESVRIPDPIHPRGDHSAPNLLISLLKTPTDLIRDAVQRIRPKYYVEKDSIDSKEGPTNVTQQTIPALPAKPPLRFRQPKHYLTGFSAYKYYRLLTTIEAKLKTSSLIADRARLLKFYRWKQQTLMDVVKIARDYYGNPTGINLERWKSLKKGLSADHQSNIDVRVQVSKVPDYPPVITCTLILAQIMALTIMCIVFGFDDTGVQTRQTVRTDIPTFLGTETFKHLQEPNPWIGPPVQAFLVSGAVMAPCMRPDKRLRIEAATKQYKPMIDSNRHYFGCCEMRGHSNRAGTTTQAECTSMTTGLGTWNKGVLCSERSSTNNDVAHVIKPCCAGMRGGCRMISHEHCQFINGRYYLECDHCVQVNCLNHLCKLTQEDTTNYIQADYDAPWLPGRDTNWQWWRFIVGIPYSFGILHLAMVMLVQLTMMLPLEMCAGWHRVLIIYTCSSVAGEMMGTIFVPDLPQVGSTGGVAGIMGVAVLELYQAWQFLKCPQWELIKLSTLIVLFLVMGTFHLMSIASFITGLAIGMMGCLMIIPYITFGRRLGHHRIRLVLFGFILLMPALAALNSMFRFIQFFKHCTPCKLAECIPYVSGMCTSYFDLYLEEYVKWFY